MNIGWKFPGNNNGSKDGFNDSGLAHFAGAKFPSVVREIIQNSLDAREPKLGKPVHVEFNIKHIPIKDFPGHNELKRIFERCCEEVEKNDHKAKKFFKEGIEVLEKRNIQVLQIADYNTTGLLSKDGIDLWESLIKGRGISSGKSVDAGGSFGIGKSAPYVISDLRTVFYSSMFEENGKDVCKAQGRSVLMSHNDAESQSTQGTGFYGNEEGLQPITGDDIPPFLVRTKRGTTVCVAGFQDIQDWGEHIKAAVVANFFVAIDEGKLCVKVGDAKDISAETLPGYFESLLEEHVDYGDFANVKLSHQMYRAMKEGKKRDIELLELGHCKIRILSDDNLPKKVGLIRNTGMMITTNQQGLRSFSGCGDFVATCVFDSTKGNALLRSMENPEHNAFQPERLEVNDHQRGKRALKKLVDEIRKAIKEITAPVENETTMLDETREFFSHVDDDGDSGKEESRDRDFEGGVVITKKKKLPPVEPLDIQEDIDEDIEEEQEGQQEGQQEDIEEERRRESVDLQKVRFVEGKSQKSVVCFTPSANGKVDLEFWIIGDERSERLIKLSKKHKNFNLIKGKRVKLPIVMEGGVRGAMMVVALKITDKESSK